MNRLKLGLRFFIVISSIVSIAVLVFLRSYLTSQISSVEDVISAQLENPNIYRQLVHLSANYHQDQINGSGDGTGPNNSLRMISSREESRQMLHKLLTDSVRYPDLIVGIVGWAITSTGDTITDFQFWSDHFGKIDSTKMIGNAVPIPNSGYSHRISPTKTGVHSFLMTDASEVDESLYLMHIRIQFTDSTYEPEYKTDAYTFQAALLAYYPVKTLPTLFTNFLVLVILFSVNLLIYFRNWVVSKRFHRYFLRGLAVMIIVFACFSLPGGFQFFGGTFTNGRAIGHLARLLPDNAFFYFAGLCLLPGRKRIKSSILGLLVIIHLISLIPQMSYTLPRLLNNESMFFVPNKEFRDIFPQLFALVSCIAIGVGIYRRGRTYLEPLIDSPSEMYEWLTVALASTFVVYGLLQPLYALIRQESFFTMALLAKVLAFSGILFFNNMEVVLQRFKRQQLVARASLNASPHPMIVFDDDGRIGQISKTGLQQLKRENILTSDIREILANETEWDFLSRLKTMQEEKNDFLIKFKTFDGCELNYLASYVPIEGENWHLISLRPLDKAVLDEIAESIQSHSTKGKVVAALNFQDQLVKTIKEVYGFKQIEEDERFVKMNQHLASAIASLRDKQSSLEERDHKSNVVTLKKVIDRIKHIEEAGEFDRLKITYDSRLLTSVDCVRHDEEILFQDIKELLTNTNNKFALEHGRGEAIIDYVFSPDTNTVKIIVQDSGSPIQEDNEKFKRFLNSSPSFLRPPRRGLESIKNNMNIFGGNLDATNVERDGKRIPTFTLTLWKAKEQ